MNEVEDKIKSIYGERVLRSAHEHLDKHDKCDIVEINDDHAGARVKYKSDVAEALIRQKRASRPRKYF